MRSILVLTLLAIIACPTLAFADDAGAANTPEEAQKAPAGKFVQDLGDRAIKVMSNKELSADQRSQKYGEILKDSFDMPTIGRFVIGRAAWNGAPPAQQQEYMDLFQKLVIKTYGERLNFYSGEGFTVKSVRPESDTDFIVGSEITHLDGSPPARVDWRIRQKNGKMAIIDVIVEGVSQSVTQRDEYSSIIQRDDGKLDGLITLMRQQLQSS